MRMRVSMRGAYCLVIELLEEHTIEVGAIGRHRFGKGVYVYVGSAQGGIHQRIARHQSRSKKLHWHIDYLLEHGHVISTISIPCDDKTRECGVAESVAQADGATVSMPGFGSSDCTCMSHLFYFGDVDPQWATESLAHALTFLQCAYAREMG